MESQAILASFHFIKSELVVAVDLHNEKVHHKILKEKHCMIDNTLDIKVVLLIVAKIKLKFFLFSTRGCAISVL